MCMRHIKKRRILFRAHVNQRGVITIPHELRKNYNIEEGDLVRISDLGNGVLVMNHSRSRVNEVANRLAQEWQESGESLSSMLEALHDVRDKNVSKTF